MSSAVPAHSAAGHETKEDAADNGDVENLVEEFVQQSSSQYTLLSSGKRVTRHQKEDVSITTGGEAESNATVAAEAATTGAASSSRRARFAGKLIDNDIFANPLPVGVFERRVRFELPLTLSPLYWKRHKYSRQDVDSTLASYKAFHMWHLSLLMQLPVATTAVKISHECRDGLIYGARKSATRQIKLLLGKRLNRYTVADFSRKSVLTFDKCRHRPKLPVQSIDAQMWNSMRDILRSRTTSSLTASRDRQHPATHDDELLESTTTRRGATTRKHDDETRLLPLQEDGYVHGGTSAAPNARFECSGLPRHRYERAFEWNGITVVPTAEASADLIEVLRIVPESFYFAHCQRPSCLTQDPRRVDIGTSEYVSTQESFYLKRRKDDATTPRTVK
jgi:hypothetical protein